MSQKKTSGISFQNYVTHLIIRQHIYIASHIKAACDNIVFLLCYAQRIMHNCLGFKWFRIATKTLKYGLISIMLVSIAWFIFIIYYLDHLSRTKEFNFDAIGSRVIIYDNQKKEINRKIFHPGRTIAIENIPPWTLDAFIAIEDRRFYQHIGIDFIGIARAFIKNLREGQIVEGASTITQQLVRNLFLSPERSIERKFKEILLALWIETRLTKDEIMELYLNRVFFGKGSKGINTAAKVYFNKAVSELTIYESAMLAGLMKAPSRDNPLANKKAAEGRANLVYERMIALNLISRDEDINRQYDPNISQKASLPQTINYALDMVYEQLGDYIGSNVSNHKGEIHVYTTLDLGMQKQAEDSLIQWITKNGKRYKAQQGAIISMKPQGEIVSIVGGVSYEDSQFNRAIKAKRQPGSAFKPIVFLAALQKGLTPFDERKDQPIQYKKWRPKNYKNQYNGVIDLTEALQNSSNSIAVQLAHEVGLDRVIKAARMLGITAKLNKNLSLALGTSELTLHELTSAYIPFANGGYISEPYLIREISTNDKVIYSRKNPVYDSIFSPEEVSFMNYMLGTVVAKGTGKAARIKNWEIAGKTGTTQDFRDSWFIGYSSRYITGVWIGNDNGEKMKNLTGGNGAAHVWKNFMQPVHSNKHPEILPSPYAVRLAAHNRDEKKDPLEILINDIDQQESEEKLDFFERHRQALDIDSKKHSLAHEVIPYTDRKKTSQLGTDIKDGGKKQKNIQDLIKSLDISNENASIYPEKHKSQMYTIDNSKNNPN